MLSALGLLISLALVRPPLAAVHQTWVVDSLEDREDDNPGDGICADADRRCTLRAAMTEANASPGEDVIVFAASGKIELRSRLPALAEVETAGPLRIEGMGRVTLDGRGAVGIVAVAARANLTLQGLNLRRGSVPGLCGGAIFNGGTLTIENCTFSENSADWVSGGAICNFSGGTLTIVNSTFSQNSASTGGAIANWEGATLTIRNSAFSGNSAGWGGAMTNWGTLAIENSALSGNRAEFGGAISNATGGTLTIANTTFSANSALLGGGAIFNGGVLTIHNSILGGNWVTNGEEGYSGGAIFNEGTLTVENSFLSRNSAGDTGGGIANRATLVVRQTAFASNEANRGGAVFNDGDVVLLNTTFWANGRASGRRATSRGGALYNVAGKTARLAHLTFVGNLAEAGGGALYVEEGSQVRIKNSLVADSPEGGNCHGPLLLYGTNFSTDQTCNRFTLVSSAALALGPLADNGGASPTHALLAGSIAMDAASDCTDIDGNPVATDQRGAARPVGARCDAGAYEAGGEAEPAPTRPTPIPTPTPVSGRTFEVNSLEDRRDVEPGDGICADALGRCTLRAAVTEANALPEDNWIVFAVTGEIVLRSSLPAVTEAQVAGTLHVEGDGRVTLSGNETVRILGVDEGGILTLREVNFRRGSAQDYGGGAIHNRGTVAMEGCTFSENSAISGGGGAMDNWGTLTIVDCRFDGNSAISGDGGAIDNRGHVTIANSTFSGNWVISGDGGAISNAAQGTLRISNSTFSGNWVNSGDGGAISNEAQGTLTIENSTIGSNSALQNGGGIAHTGGLLRAIGLRFVDNMAGGDGGALYNHSAVRMRDSTLARNTSRRGAAIFNAGSVRLVNVTISQNVAEQDGGAFYNNSGTTSEIIFSTIYGNQAGTRGAGIFGELGLVRVKNSIVAGVAGVGNCEGISAPRGWNYSTDATCLGFEMVGIEALRLGPLAANGGPTETHALLAGSVALDVAPDCNDTNDLPVIFDQRGVKRPHGTACDLGAYEEGSAPSPLRTLTPTPTQTRVTPEIPSPTETPIPTVTTTVARTPTTTVTTVPGQTLTPLPSATPATAHTATATSTTARIPTSTPTPPRCQGDCNGDGVVTVEELVQMVNIALGSTGVTNCSAGDANRDGEITIEEVVAAVNRALNGC
ncbi:MAG: hypothetical protein KatS3mg077_2691 [Candidatus Binatia bacterium]|nr:MAG: hypothetical protein KatS3mg077_2691 [Candidatus Binatia bacterium]